MNNRKRGMTQETIAGIIILILVVATILWFLFGASIKNLIYNLPSYNTPKEDAEIDASGQTDISANIPTDNLKDIPAETAYKEKCFEYCRFFGECKEVGSVDEINLGKMDCGTNKDCYAKKNVEVLKSGELSLTEFSYIDNGKNVDFFGKNEIEIAEGKIIILSYYIESSDGFCYSLKYGGEPIVKEYFEGNALSLNSKLISKKGFLEIAAWNPDGKEFVVKRIEIKSLGLPEGYENGKIIEDKNFKKEVSDSKNGDIFYVFGLYYQWKGTTSSSDYKIKVGNGNLEIYILGKSLNKKEKWFLLDCYFGYGKSIKISKIKNSLSETLESCGT